MSNAKPKLTKAQIRDELFRRAELRFLLHDVQKEMYDNFKKAEKNSVSVWLISRQTGKSAMLAILAIEEALRNKYSIIKLVTDTKQHVKSIFEPLFRQFLEHCPSDLQPSYSTSQFLYQFPNGSQIQLAGSDSKNYEKLRGQKSQLILVDEAGFCNDLEDMVYSVLIPTTTHTGGKIILSSTPPEDPAHPFIKFIEEAEMNGTLIKKTIFDNPLLTKEQVDNIIKKMGGVNSERFQREYMCKIVKSATASVIPEFTEEIKLATVKEWPRPPFYHSYEAMDIGGRDLTAVLFAYYDFRSAKIIVEDEIIFDFRIKGNSIEKLTQLIKEKEESLWVDPITLEKMQPYKRTSDTNPIVLGEIRKYSNYQINFEATLKDNMHAAINNLRTMIGSQRLIINPRCKILIRHLENVRWSGSNSRDEFARSPDNAHYDAVSACVYLVRNIDFNKNPYPAHYDYNTKDLFIANPTKFNGTSQIEAFKKLFNVPTKRKW